MAQVVFLRHLKQGTVFSSRPSLVGFVVEKVTMKQAFLLVLRLSRVSVIHQCSTPVH